MMMIKADNDKKIMAVMMVESLSLNKVHCIALQFRTKSLRSFWAAPEKQLACAGYGYEIGLHCDDDDDKVIGPFLARGRTNNP